MDDTNWFAARDPSRQQCGAPRKYDRAGWAA